MKRVLFNLQILHYEFAASKYNTYSNGEKTRALGLY